MKIFRLINLLDIFQLVFDFIARKIKEYLLRKKEENMINLARYFIKSKIIFIL